jgi:4-hydroxy-2-oxoheptanedioate aldolase
MIADKANASGKIAGIHNGTTEYAKDMINIGYKFVTVSSDFRSMSSHAQQVLNEMKDLDDGTPSSSY